MYTSSKCTGTGELRIEISIGPEIRRDYIVSFFHVVEVSFFGLFISRDIKKGNAFNERKNNFLF